MSEKHTILCKRRYILKRYLLFCSLFFVFCSFIMAQNNNFITGEELFKKNKPDEAIPYLEEAVSKGENPKAYVYLVVSYYQIGHYEEALNIADRGMRVTGSNKKIIAYNAGNAAFLLQDYKSAEEWYSKALIADPSYSSAILNRANARISLEKYADCIDDYTKFLELEPEDRRRDDIIALLEKLKKVKEEQEQEQLAQQLAQQQEQERIRQEEERYQAEIKRQEQAEAERKYQEQLAQEAQAKAEAERKYQEQLAQEAQAKAEAERLYQEQLAQEAKAKAEAEAAAERRRKLLEEVAASLQDSSTENMSAGAEDTVDYDYESELE